MKLGDLPIPSGVEERTLAVVREAFAVRTPNPRRRPSFRRALPVVLLATVAALAISAVAVRASGGSVLATVRDALGVRNAATALTRLPTSGRLLVNSAAGPSIVNPDGAKRHLAGSGYTQASWSPHGLFEVVVVRGMELAAIDPKGSLRWALRREAVSEPRWSADGYRIAYRSGTTLRVVAGDGTGDHVVARLTAAAAPAWYGSSSNHELVYADRRGRIHLVNADTGKAIWTSDPGPAPTQIAVEPGGRQIVAVSRGVVRVLHAANGRLFKQIPLAGSSHQLAISPTGPAALTIRSGPGQSSIVLLHPQHPWLKLRPIFHGVGTFNSLAWSPNGQWLLASWVSADQWVFIKLNIHTGAVEHVQAVSAIAAQFNSATPPSLAGWCCAPGSP